MRVIIAIALLGMIALAAAQEQNFHFGGGSRKHRGDDFNAEGGASGHKKHPRFDDFNAEGGHGGSSQHKKHPRFDDFNAEGGHGASSQHKKHKKLDDFNAEGGSVKIHISGAPHPHPAHPTNKKQAHKKFDDFNGESTKKVPHGKVPKPPKTHEKKKSKHHQLFESDYCAMTKYAECKQALAPFLQSIETVLGAGDAVNTCLQLKECPVAQKNVFQPSFLGNKWTTFAEDLEKAGEWLLVDSQCEQDLGAELFLASNLIVDFKSVGNDIMDIIFMALFGEKAYQACSPLIWGPLRTHS